MTVKPPHPAIARPDQARLGTGLPAGFAEHAPKHPSVRLKAPGCRTVRSENAQTASSPRAYKPVRRVKALPDPQNSAHRSKPMPDHTKPHATPKHCRISKTVCAELNCKTKNCRSKRCTHPSSPLPPKITARINEGFSDSRRSRRQNRTPPNVPSRKACVLNPPETPAPLRKSRTEAARIPPFRRIAHIKDAKIKKYVYRIPGMWYTVFI